MRLKISPPSPANPRPISRRCAWMLTSVGRLGHVPIRARLRYFQTLTEVPSETWMVEAPWTGKRGSSDSTPSRR